jgi:TRAP-type C4-dicarboxylate transport system permease small subunit
MRRQIDLLDAGFNRLLTFLAALTAISIGLIAAIIPLNLLLIKMQWGSIWWTYEAVEYILYAGVFIAAPWALRQGAHVRVDVATSALPRHLAARLEQVLDVFGIGLCLLLCFYGVRAAISEFEDGTLPDKDLRIANWYMLSVFALSFFLLAVEFLFRLRRAHAAAGEEDSVAESGF